MLSDDLIADPSSSFTHAKQQFALGHLEDSQREAEEGYRQFMSSNPLWARRFQLLEATAMAWRGLHSDVLELLSEDRIPWIAQNDNIQRLSLESSSLTHIHRFTDAEKMLSEADKLCSPDPPIQCGATLRAHGLLFLELGKTEQAKTAFHASLDFARQHGDGLLEATSLQNLGFIASQEEHHDEALAYYRHAADRATQLGTADLEQRNLGNEGWEQYVLGNSKKALEDFGAAQLQAASVGDLRYEVLWLMTSATAYQGTGQLTLAESSALRALKIAHQTSDGQQIIDAIEVLGQIYVEEGKPAESDRYSSEALALLQKTDSRPDMLYCHMLQGEAAALRHDWPRAESLLHEVILAQESQSRMRWNSQHTLAQIYEAQGRMPEAEQSYKAAIALVEGARGDLKQEGSQLSFLNNAARIYDDYIHFLVTQVRSNEALEAADWSRARTLQQGLGLIPANASVKVPPLRATEVAHRANATLLFYWMGERESYLWAVSPEKMTLVKLPPKNEIVAKIERYGRTLLALKDPVRTDGGIADKDRRGDGDNDGRDLYEMLVAPASSAISPSRPIVLFTDGAMTQLNFETLLVGGPTPHYWIEDATVSSAPSIHLFAAKAKSVSVASDKLLVLGDAVSADPALPHLPMAALEIQRVKTNFKSSDGAVFSGAQATPLTYIASKPEQFSYIHFVAHGTASNTDPLESAVILSRDNGGLYKDNNRLFKDNNGLSKDDSGLSRDANGEDSYKLYAREILQHPISARLVTISACNSSGSASFAGEGVIGLSWAFLRAGAHNTIGALWDVSDASTPELMDHLYAGLQRKEPPATALREAKLALLHSGGNFSRPFYWAPFQLYSGH